MNDAVIVDGNKVLVELDWEQIDSIIRNELREHIIMCERDINGSWVHPDDAEHNKILLPALYVVYDYYAGKEEVKKLKEELNETVRSSE